MSVGVRSLAQHGSRVNLPGTAHAHAAEPQTGRSIQRPVREALLDYLGAEEPLRFLVVALHADDLRQRAAKIASGI